VPGYTTSSGIVPGRQVHFSFGYNITGSKPDEKGKGISQYHLDRPVLPDFNPIPNPQTLTRLAWVVILDSEHVKQYAELLTSIECYCVRQGISFYIDYRVIRAEGHFFVSRHYNVLKYLKYHQWVLATDADILVGDSSVDIYKSILDKADDDNIDLVVADRDGGELCACAYIVKNSPGGWSFMHRWLSWSDVEGRTPLNGDNGDLVEMVHAGMTPAAPNNATNTGRMADAEIDVPASSREHCINPDAKLGEYLDSWWSFLACVQVKFHRFRAEYPRVPYWDHRLWDWTDVKIPTNIRVYKTYGGFIRSSPTVAGQQHFHTIPAYVEGDFLYHLHKRDDLWAPQMTLCTGEDWQYEPK
jgi:hypothetical protein